MTNNSSNSATPKASNTEPSKSPEQNSPEPKPLPKLENKQTSEPVIELDSELDSELESELRSELDSELGIKLDYEPGIEIDSELNVELATEPSGVQEQSLDTLLASASSVSTFSASTSGSNNSSQPASGSSTFQSQEPVSYLPDPLTSFRIASNIQEYPSLVNWQQSRQAQEELAENLASESSQGVNDDSSASSSGKKFSQFTAAERKLLQSLLRRKLPKSQIAQRLGKSYSSILREIKRHKNANGVYHHQQANETATKTKSRISQTSIFSKHPILVRVLERAFKRYGQDYHKVLDSLLVKTTIQALNLGVNQNKINRQSLRYHFPNGKFKGRELILEQLTYKKLVFDQWELKSIAPKLEKLNEFYAEHDFEEIMFHAQVAVAAEALESRVESPDLDHTSKASTSIIPTTDNSPELSLLELREELENLQIPQVFIGEAEALEQLTSSQLDFKQGKKKNQKTSKGKVKSKRKIKVER